MRVFIPGCAHCGELLPNPVPVLAQVGRHRCVKRRQDVRTDFPPHPNTLGGGRRSFLGRKLALGRGGERDRERERERERERKGGKS